jgi:hypothetical protein
LSAHRASLVAIVREAPDFRSGGHLQHERERDSRLGPRRCLTRGCSGPGCVRVRPGRGIVETSEEGAAAEPPGR